jgi:hypothetical protein
LGVVRTIYYVDGLNLYKRCLTGPSLKWLNLQRLFETELPLNPADRIRYFTALVTKYPDPDAVTRQRVYLAALRTIPGLTVHYGTMRTDVKTMTSVVGGKPGPEVQVFHTREKGTDVNLAARLFHDLATVPDRFDAAVLVTHDSDQVETIRLALEVTDKPIGVLDPEPTRAKHLHSAASFYRNIHVRHVRNSQFPDEVSLPRGGLAIKPTSW